MFERLAAPANCILMRDEVPGEPLHLFWRAREASLVLSASAIQKISSVGTWIHDWETTSCQHLRGWARVLEEPMGYYRLYFLDAFHGRIDRFIQFELESTNSDRFCAGMAGQPHS